MNTVTIKTSVGDWELFKPKAGVRNRALQKCELPGGQLKLVSFLMELLPKCIGRRPDTFDKDVPIEQQLDGLSLEDYDLLMEGMNLLVDKGLSEEKKTQSENIVNTETGQKVAEIN